MSLFGHIVIGAHARMLALAQCWVRATLGRLRSSHRTSHRTWHRSWHRTWHRTWPLGGTRDRGQATTEYALVMLAAALVALLVVAWATGGGGAGKIGQLFDRILDEVIGRI